MSEMKMTKSISILRSFLAPALGLFLAATAHAAVPGITGPTFTLTAQTAFLNQPDGEQVYSWGYGCGSAAGAVAPTGFAPAAITNASCPLMQVPGPTLIVTEGQTVTVNLYNGLPAAAGNTSILFPGFVVSASGGVTGLLTKEAVPQGTVSYTFVASSPGTHAYYSGTQGDLQVEMGLYGAVVVLPSSMPANCTAGLPATNPGANTTAQTFWGESDFRLKNASGQVGAAYDNARTCYDREYLFQWAEMDPNIHRAAVAQVASTTTACAGYVANGSGVLPTGCGLNIPTEPYHPAYYIINGRSMPDVMDGNYAGEYPHQPYNGNPHMHPGEMTLVRTIGQGRWQHPFHEHANHVRILARDGNLQLASDGSDLAGLLMFNTDTTPGEAFDGIFYFSGRGLNWDAYGHHPGSTDANATLGCTPDANGYNTSAPTAINYFEWCQDHNKPLEVAPIGDVGAGGPATLPDPNIFTNGPWYGGTPYLGPDATLRGGGQQACLNGLGTTNNVPNTAGSSVCSTLQPSNIQANPANERGWAYMWHSHNEREITTNNVFPGGMLMMMLVDSREFVIDESK